MAAGALPADGELQLGPVVLPAGRRVTPLQDDAPVAWVTRNTVPEPGLVWSALTDLQHQTGLVPVVLQDDEDDIEDVFFEPCDVGQVDGLDPAELLAAHWEGELDDDERQAPGHRETPRVTEFLGLKVPGEGPNSLADIAMAIARVVQDPDASAELSRRSELDCQDAAPEYEQWAARSAEREARRAQIPFPGLAPPTGGSLSSAERITALRSIPPARIGLIPAARSADVMPVAGWSCFDDPAFDDEIRNAVWIAAILRSWEHRFAARLLTIGPGAEISLLVQRPTRTIEAARKIAEEHSAFCTECAGQGLRSVRHIAPALLNAPVWTFWWEDD